MNSLTSKDRDLTTGNIRSKLIAFATPLILMNLLQAIYNVVDMIIVGQFMGSAGMSAVSIGGQITHLILAICNGLSNAGAVCVGQMFGARKSDQIRPVVGTLLSFLVLTALGFTAVCLIFGRQILNLLNTPDECYTQAVQYLSICAAGTVFIYGYNGLSAALRGIGESLNPLLYVTITTVENIVLDLFFVAVLGMGAAGAAVATVISQFTSLCLVIWYVHRKTALFDFKPSSFRINKAYLGQIVMVGMPQSIQYTCTNICFLFISALINSYGVDAAAAAGAANKIGTFGTLPGLAMSSALVTFTAQNLPQKNYERIIKGTWTGIAIALCVSGCIFFICELFPQMMYRLFTSDAAVAQTGTTYLRIYAICFFDEVFMFCLYGIPTGSGYTKVTMVSSIAMAVGVRYFAALLLSRYTPLGLNGIALAYAIAPLLGIAMVGGFILSGKWKNNKVKIAD